MYATDSYEDVTSEFDAFARDLGPGNVATAPGFQMYDALPAFQIGTPKVDTGSPAEFVPLAQQLAAAKSSFPLDSDAACAELMDVMQCAEMAWHRGHSLPQSVLACAFVESELIKLTSLQLKSPPDLSGGHIEAQAIVEYMNMLGHYEAQSALVPLTQLFCWSLIKAIGVCIDVSEGPGASVITPEEDLHLVRHGLYFLDRTPLQQLIEQLERAKKLASQCGLTLIAERLALRASWLTVLKGKVPKKVANLDRLAKQIEEWEPIGNFQIPEKSDEAQAGAFSKWFTRHCQSRLAMACLRQPLYIPSTSESKKFWLSVVHAIRNFVPVYSISRSVDLLGFFLAFSSRREPPIVRAMARALATDTQILGQATKHWAALDISETLPPQELKSNQNVDQFLAQAGWCYVDLITSFCMNRCRMRETLGALVVSFDSLQVAAAQLDEVLAISASLQAPDGSQVPSMPFSSWTHFRKLQVMLWMILLSFETGVLSPQEVAYTNWYAMRICQHLLTQLGRMRLAFEQYGQGARESPGYNYLVALELESQMLQQMLTAQYMLWIAIDKLRKLPQLPNVSREVQFALRFQAFESVGVPEMLTVTEFDELANSLDVSTALQTAGASAQSVRKLISTLSALATENIEIPLIQRSAIGLSVAVATLVKLGHEPVDVSVTTENFHWYFPVAKISKRL